MDYEKLNACRLFVLDMDGTLYLGDTVFPFSIGFMESLGRKGKKFVYLTNNSSRAGIDYVNRLQGMGFPCSAENILSSGMATAMYLNEHHPGAGVCLVGTAALQRELESYGITIDNENADVVVAGFDTELVYEKLERAVHHLRRGAPFIACNPDWVCPMPHGEVLPDCGSICALLTASSGVKPTYIGKPNRNILEIIAKRFDVSVSEICSIGDRLYTDIAVAKNAGAVSALVLSGETSEEMLRCSDIQPDYVFQTVAELGSKLN